MVKMRYLIVAVGIVGIGATCGSATANEAGKGGVNKKQYQQAAQSPNVAGGGDGSGGGAGSGGGSGGAPHGAAPAYVGSVVIGGPLPINGSAGIGKPTPPAGGPDDGLISTAAKNSTAVSSGAGRMIRDVDTNVPQGPGLQLGDSLSAGQGKPAGGAVGSVSDGVAAAQSPNVAGGGGGDGSGGGAGSGGGSGGAPHGAAPASVGSVVIGGPLPINGSAGIGKPTPPAGGPDDGLISTAAENSTAVSSGAGRMIRDVDTNVPQGPGLLGDSLSAGQGSPAGGAVGSVSDGVVAAGAATTGPASSPPGLGGP